MKRTAQWSGTSTTATTTTTTALQVRNKSEEQCLPEKSSCRTGMYFHRRTLQPTFTVKQQEMMSFLELFDDLIHDFLLMDCCCKITDKYLLAMVFIYFKRSHLTIAEYTKKNFFIALYLANSMEEEEEESKYEIFPWALGKTWRKKVKQFLKMKDNFWVRIEFRAAVSRRCCEEVMAIMPSHFVWKRERSEEHSGAHRKTDKVSFPRGPSASPVPCIRCNRKSAFSQRLQISRSLSLPSCKNKISQSTPLSLEKTPPPIATCRETSDQTQRSSNGSELPGSLSSDSYMYDSSMDWINK
ncbi:speedy protein A isoform X2 [Syngnathus scovelli]|uniref:speedy protein A isoform X2 n=1 Tax=Syngnathus scovelli TaxID=161590 RepID=UPI00210FA01C|nr:speedy protein A isoform X2 [Syngnathus scovelli]